MPKKTKTRTKIKKVYVKVKQKTRSRRGMSTINKFISTVIPLSAVGAFVSQVIAKDISKTNFQEANTEAKLKFITAKVVGNITGIQIFPEYQASRQFNLAGIINKWTGIGIASMLYSTFSPKGFPLKSISRKISKSYLPAGILGGLFDDPPALQQPRYNPSLNSNIPTPNLNGTSVYN